MGNYVIKIHGHGQHHNQMKQDADTLAALLVYDLQSAGHTIDSASIQITDPQYRGGEKESLLSKEAEDKKIVYPTVTHVDGIDREYGNPIIETDIIETDSID